MLHYASTNDDQSGHANPERCTKHIALAASSTMMIVLHTYVFMYELLNGTVAAVDSVTLREQFHCLSITSQLRSVRGNTAVCTTADVLHAVQRYYSAQPHSLLAVAHP